MSNKKKKNRNTQQESSGSTDIRSFMKSNQNDVNNSNLNRFKESENDFISNDYFVQSFDDNLDNNSEQQTQKIDFINNNRTTQFNNPNNEYSFKEEKKRDNTINDFMNFFQVNNIINPKYNRNERNHSVVDNSKIVQLPIDQLVEMSLLFKLSGESEFIRDLTMYEPGRKFIKQMELCLETLQNIINMSPDSFKQTLNYVVNKHKQLCSPSE